MTVLLENQRQARKARLVMLGTIVWSIGWLYWSYVLAQSFGLAPGDGGSLRPANQRYAISALALVVAIAPVVGMIVYGRVYLMRLERDGDALALTTLGFLFPHTFLVRLSDLTGSTTYDDDKPGVSLAEAPWITLRVKGYRLPFIVDLQAEHVNAGAIRALIRRKKKDD